MRVTRLAPDPRDSERVRVYVDGAMHGTLSAELVLAARLREGDEVTPQQLESLAADDEPHRVRAAALALLAVRQRSREELRQRLRRKGFAAEVVDACLARLEGLKLVDDSAFAQAFARDRRRFRPQGKLRTVMELRGRGVDKSLAAEAVHEALADEGESEADLARQAAAKFRVRSGEERERARRRLFAFLARRGFEPEVVREVADEVLK